MPRIIVCRAVSQVEWRRAWRGPRPILPPHSVGRSYAMSLRSASTYLLLAICLVQSSFCGSQRADAEEKPAKPFELAAAATPPEQIRVPAGFKVDLLYSVPKDQEGSWVNLCYDPKGRLIVSDQYGGLYRITLPTASEKLKIEKVP